MMQTYKTQMRYSDRVAQSRVVNSSRGHRWHPWSVELMRKRSRRGGVERRGWTLFVSVGGYRFQVGKG
jgi:hypothetical protein